MDKRQPNLFDYFNGKVKAPTPEEQRKREKRLQIARAKRHLKEFYRFVLESIDKNSISLVLIAGLANQTQREMEAEGVCYFKKMPNNEVRVFKKVYCCFELEDWKKCPEFKCLAWPCYNFPECPHKHESSENIEEPPNEQEIITIVYDNRKKEAEPRR